MTFGNVIAFIGLPGAGKTYMAVSLLHATRRRDPLRRIYSNIPLRLPGARVRSLETVEDWMECHDGIVLMDEAYLMLGSREWNAKDRQRVAEKLGQLRKAGIALMYTTHTGGKVDIRLRELTEEVYLLRAPFGPKGPFYYTQFAGFGTKMKKMRSGFKWRRADVDQAYDTRGAVGSSGLAVDRQYQDTVDDRPDVLNLGYLERERRAAGHYIITPRGTANPTPTPINATRAYVS